MIKREFILTLEEIQMAMLLLSEGYFSSSVYLEDIDRLVFESENKADIVKDEQIISMIRKSYVE